MIAEGSKLSVQRRVGALAEGPALRCVSSASTPPAAVSPGDAQTAGDAYSRECEGPHGQAGVPPGGQEILFPKKMYALDTCDTPLCFARRVGRHTFPP
eukprot:gene12089-biopygen13989